MAGLEGRQAEVDGRGEQGGRRATGGATREEAEAVATYRGAAGGVEQARDLKKGSGAGMRWRRWWSVGHGRLGRSAWC